MSISDTDRSSAKVRYTKTVIVYTAVSVLCAVFAAIYRYFSHGVFSPYLIYMSLIPLLAGALPFFALKLISANKRNTGKTLGQSRIAYNLYNAGVSAFTVGSCQRGGLDVYGTENSLVIVYPVAGAVFVACAVVVHVINVVTNSEKSGQ